MVGFDPGISHATVRQLETRPLQWLTKETVDNCNYFHVFFFVIQLTDVLTKTETVHTNRFHIFAPENEQNEQQDLTTEQTS